jgi:hypothetical protein
VRVIAQTEAYQRQLPAEFDRSGTRESSASGDGGILTNSATGETPFTAARPAKLRGDEVFDSLVTALGLPNVKPEPKKPTGDIRFPPPPKSTRDIVAETFGFDPSLTAQDIPRTMPQVMLMMNNDQLQAQINADPDSGTMLARLLAQESDDKAAVAQLYQNVLARAPKDKELEIALEHLSTGGKRSEAFEDLLWSLINSAEFTSKR